jgi:hypothetical protein
MTSSINLSLARNWHSWVSYQPVNRRVARKAKKLSRII